MKTAHDREIRAAIAERLREIVKISFAPVTDFSDEAIRQHWKYRDRNDLRERDRLMYVAGYLEGRTTETQYWRECIKTLLDQLESNEARG